MTIKKVYILVEVDKATKNTTKIGPVYKREDRANSVCYLLKSQTEDKDYHVIAQEVL